MQICANGMVPFSQEYDGHRCKYLYQCRTPESRQEILAGALGRVDRFRLEAHIDHIFKSKRT